jgi:AcrR family transcriptional regulator
MSRHRLLAQDSSEPAAARRRIVTAARRHFLAHGFRGVTMDDLAAELGMSKKTLYAHFPGKTALLEAMLEEKFRDLEADVARITAGSAADFAAGLESLLACLGRHAAEVQPAFVRDIQREAPRLFDLVEKRRAEIIERHFGKLLGAGRRQGRIRKDVPVDIIIAVLLGSTQAIMNPPRMAELGLTPASGYAAIITLVLEGALVRDARPVS